MIRRGFAEANGLLSASAFHCTPREGTMSARTALLTLARRAGKAPVRVSRRNMSGGSIEEEIGAHPSRAPSRLIERVY